MIKWEPKHPQEKKHGMAFAGHGSMAPENFCQAQKLKHYPLVLVVVLSLVPGCPMPLSDGSKYNCVDPVNYCCNDTSVDDYHHRLDAFRLYW